MNATSKPRYLALAVAVCLVAAPAARAKEGGDQYAYGAETFLGGALPPPGTYFLNYFIYYHGTLRGGAQEKVSVAGATPTVDAQADALRFLHVTPFRILGASYAMHVIIPLVHQSVDLGGSRGNFGVADITFDPLVLGWHGERWHAVLATDIIAPTGAYDRNDPRVSLGANYWSFEPIAAFTYRDERGFDLSTKIMYNVKAENGATQYRSGDEIHVDFLAGKNFGAWGIGAGGYFIEQVTDDKLDGITVPAGPGGLWSEGRKGQALGIGPAVTYSKSGVMLEAKYFHEVAVRNRFGGDRFQLKLVLPLSPLLGP